MSPDPAPKNKPADAEAYISSNQGKVDALRRALWEAGFKVHSYPDKRTNPEVDVWVLYHNAPDFKFREIRQSITF